MILRMWQTQHSLPACAVRNGRTNLLQGGVAALQGLHHLLPALCSVAAGALSQAGAV